MIKNSKLILFFSIVMLAGCEQASPPAAKESGFPVTTLFPIDTTAFTEYSAEINAVQNTELRAKVSGYLEQIHIDEGGFVQEGQLLFSINDLEYKGELSKATAAYKSAVAEQNNAAINLKSVKTLVDKNVVSQSELDIAANKLEAARAGVEEAKAVEAAARLKLSYTQIRAPFSGKVNRLSHKTGSLIEEGTLLTTLSQDKEVFAYFHVSEKEYLNYAFNRKSDSLHSAQVSLILANDREHAVKGRIETIESEIDQSTGNIAFRARFSNPDYLLKHGASGKIRLMKRYKDVIVVPQKSTFEIQDKIYVYILDKDGIVRSRAITALNPLPHLYVVRSGLRSGDRIVYEGIQNIKEGNRISVQPVSMPDIFKQLATR